jgi:hypothetical protein
MKLKIVVVDLEIPRHTKRIMVLVGIPIAVMLGVSAVALATVPHTFNSGDVLNATDLNVDFTTLDTRLSAVEAKRPVASAGDGGLSYSLDAKYCGKTGTTTGAFASGLLTGWAAAKSLCQAACGASATAHMCGGEELIRSVQIGVPPTSTGWAAQAFAGLTQSGTNYVIENCEGWTSASATVSGFGNLGQIWSGNTNATDACNTSYPILCCD